jgi:Tfp pilus assembly protein PilW
MKLPLPPAACATSATVQRRWLGYTLTEIMVTMVVIMMVLAAVISCHLLGLRLFELTKAKLGASDDARHAIGLLISEIRSAKIVRVGSGDLDSFTAVGVNTPHRGNALEVYATTNTNFWVRYFLDSDKKLKRATNGASTARVIASSISNSNQPVFSAEDFTGTPLLNNSRDYVIGLNLQFSQLQYPEVEIGPGQFYDYYQLQTRVTPRAP